MSRKSGKLKVPKQRAGNFFEAAQHEEEMDRMERLHNILREDPVDPPVIRNQKRDFKKIFNLD